MHQPNAERAPDGQRVADRCRHAERPQPEVPQLVRAEVQHQALLGACPWAYRRARDRPTSPSPTCRSAASPVALAADHVGSLHGADRAQGRADLLSATSMACGSC